MKKIVILGSTGSIGTTALEVIRKLGMHRSGAYLGKDYQILGLSADRNIELLEKQIREFRPKVVAVMDGEASEKLRAKSKELKVKVLSGIEGLKNLASLPEANFIVFAVVGAIGLVPFLEAIKAGKTVALANKETLVIAGEIILTEIKKYQAKILPLDSEHSAIFQCIDKEDRKEVKRIILTASGGPFYRHSLEQLRKVTVEEALKHPQWKMGKKITIDSATLMNKGLEIIEAHYLFGLPYEKISILIHPESIVHSMVEFVDGTLKAQISLPDMRFPIQYALTYPRRIDTDLPSLDWDKVKRLNFFLPEKKKFPCLDLAIEAGKKGGTYPAVLNATNEIAVDSFLKKKISFLQIAEIVGKVLAKHKSIKNPKLEDILAYDSWARIKTEELIKA